MSKKKNYKYYSKLINKIQKTRAKKNKNWMDLLRLAFKENPKMPKNRKRDFQGR